MMIDPVRELQQAERENKKLNNKKRFFSFSFTPLFALLVLFLVFGFSFSRAYIGHLSVERSRLTVVKNTYELFKAHQANFGELPSSKSSANAALLPLFGSEGEFKPNTDNPFYSRHFHNVPVNEKAETLASLDQFKEAGSNIYAYWTLADGSGLNLDSCEPNAPLLSAPMLSRNNNPTFGDGFYDSENTAKAVVLKADGSVVVYDLDSSGRLKLDDEEKRAGKKYRACLPVGCMP